MRMWKLTVPMVVFGMLALAVHTRAIAAEDAKSDKGKITGSVVDKDGKAVASAKIRLMTPKSGGAVATPKADKAGPKPAIAETTSDSEGKFKLDDVAPGNYTIAANLKGVGMAKQDIEVKAGETATVELKIEPKPAK